MKQSNINLYDWILTMLDGTEEAANKEYLSLTKTNDVKKIAKALGYTQGIIVVKDLIKNWKHHEIHKKTIAVLDSDEHRKLIGEISTMVTTKEQIEEIIGEVKRTIDEWTYDDICEALPNDCEITWFDGQDEYIEI